MVEVDASDLEVRAVLYQCDPADQKLCSCGFFSWHISPVEENKGLLAVVLTLQEWRHWLEGSAQPFLIWTHHKNLSYLRIAKKLNSR